MMGVEKVKKQAAQVVERIRMELNKIEDVNHKIEYVDDVMDELEQIHQKLWDSHDDLDIDEDLEEEGGRWLAE